MKPDVNVVQKICDDKKENNEMGIMKREIWMSDLPVKAIKFCSFESNNIFLIGVSLDIGW